MERTLVSNIQHYCIHDGEGIRTTVFLKGCPLRCFWCANPENQDGRQELMHYAHKCAGCGACVSACGADAIRLADGVSRVSRTRCTACGDCADVCLYGALRLAAQPRTVLETAEECLKDAAFFENSAGGVTISGGEALGFAPFCCELADLLRHNGAGVVFETCGYGAYDTLRAYAERADQIFFDIKHHDPEVHRAATGVTNERILENFSRLTGWYDRVAVRIPVVPGFNDSEEDMRALAELIRRRAGSRGILYVELLPYHNFGEPKYAALDRPYQLAGEPRMDRTHVLQYQKLFEAQGLKCVVK